ncbi:DUF2971 domain-containing protein [Rhodoferax sp.]|uniref:DUF2971 domain-containing protein n=1 Tax=Rhodoferax sp. TaxID=50421 RepID=UPI0025FA6FDE|nr:DUF2971 domain-containing protein [Rhodoferax sp.]
MSVYKYFSPENAERYLTTWAMRLTPPNRVNDPFEMRPSFDAFSEAAVQKFLSTRAQDLSKEVAMKIAAKLPHKSEGTNNPALSALARYLFDCETEEDLATLLQITSSAELHAIRVQAQKAIYDQLPTWNSDTENALRQSAAESLGMLCLSGSSNNPLMWAHYAKSHEGVVVEFDENHPTFHRRRSSVDEFGYLRRVSYADTRPSISKIDGNDTFIQLAFVKGLDWAYEQEHRMIWPLSLADCSKSIGEETIYLLEVPALAVKSLTFGCKAEASFTQQIVQILSQNKDAGHIQVYQSFVSTDTFALCYQPYQGVDNEALSK